MTCPFKYSLLNHLFVAQLFWGKNLEINCEFKFCAAFETKTKPGKMFLCFNKTKISSCIYIKSCNTSGFDNLLACCRWYVRLAVKAELLFACKSGCICGRCWCSPLNIKGDFTEPLNRKKQQEMRSAMITAGMCQRLKIGVSSTCFCPYWWID